MIDTTRYQIHAGDTALSCSITVQQAGLELTICPGTFTTTGDLEKGIPPETYTLESPVVLSITPGDLDTYYQVDLGLLDGEFKVLARVSNQSLPDNWQQIQCLIYEFCVPSGTTSLEEIEILVFTVLPGFPAGETPPISEPEILSPSPNWQDFFTRILGTHAWSQIVEHGNAIRVSSLITQISFKPETIEQLERLKMLWDNVLESTELTLRHFEELNQLAIDARMPFRFGVDEDSLGELLLNGTGDAPP